MDVAEAVRSALLFYPILTKLKFIHTFYTANLSMYEMQHKFVQL